MATVFFNGYNNKQTSFRQYNNKTKQNNNIYIIKLYISLYILVL